MVEVRFSKYAYARRFDDLGPAERDRVIDALLRVNEQLGLAQARHFGFSRTGRLRRDTCASRQELNCPHIRMASAHLAHIRGYVSGDEYFVAPRPPWQRRGIPGRPLMETR